MTPNQPLIVVEGLDKAQVQAHVRHAPTTQLLVPITGYHRTDPPHRGGVHESAAAHQPASHQRDERLRLAGVDGDTEYHLGDLQQRQDDARHTAAAQALFRALGSDVTPGADTNDALKIYPLKETLGHTREEVQRKLDHWLKGAGWSYRIFGPGEDGQGWTDPVFQGQSYPEHNVWIFQPSAANTFGDYAYTLAWRVTHEIGHGLTNAQMTAKYGGQGRRMGRLGSVKRYSAPGREAMVKDPLTLADGLRALDWEDAAFRKQREILQHDLGITITDEQFAREYSVNMSDAVYRVLTGVFSSPGDWGVMPTAQDPAITLERAKAMLRTAAAELGIDRNETFWKPLEGATTYLPFESEGRGHVKPMVWGSHPLSADQLAAETHREQRLIEAMHHETMGLPAWFPITHVRGAITGVFGKAVGAVALLVKAKPVRVKPYIRGGRHVSGYQQERSGEVDDPCGALDEKTGSNCVRATGHKGDHDYRPDPAPSLVDTRHITVDELKAAAARAVVKARVDVKPYVRAGHVVEGYDQQRAEAAYQMHRDAYAPRPKGNIAGAPEKEQAWHQHFAKDREWRGEMKRAISRGDVAPDDATALGFEDHPPSVRPEKKGTGAHGWEPMPPTMYHVTTARSKVLAEGLKPRSQVQREGGGQGLGGGDDESISTTESLETARAIMGGLRMAHQVVRGKKDLRELIRDAASGRGAKREWLTDLIRGGTSHIPGEKDWAPGKPLPEAWQALLRNEKIITSEGGSPFDEATLPKGARPFGYSWQGGDDKTRWTRARAPMSDDEKREHMTSAFKHWSAHREAAGGPEDPLFWGDLDSLRKVRDRDLAIMKVTPKPGATGHKMGGMGEWRTYSGDKLSVADVEPEERPGAPPSNVEELLAVSPNTEEHLTLAQAVARMRSGEQARYRRLIDEHDRALGVTPTSRDAVGDWADGAENAVVSTWTERKDWPTLRRAAAERGLAGHQKAVLAFARDEAGPDYVYQLTVPATVGIPAIRTACQEAGIEFRTLVPGQDTITAVVYDEGGQLHDQMNLVAEHFKVGYEGFRGKGEYVGRPAGKTGEWSREEARREYETILRGSNDRGAPRPGRASVSGHGGSAGPPQQGQGGARRQGPLLSVVARSWRGLATLVKARVHVKPYVRIDPRAGAVYVGGHETEHRLAPPAVDAIKDFVHVDIKNDSTALTGLVVASAEQAAALTATLKNADREHCWVIHCDETGHVLALDALSTGTLSASLISPREVFKVAQQIGTKRIWLVHNHPSGDPEPSVADRRRSQELFSGAADLGIQIEGSLVIGSTEAVDYGPRGLEDSRGDRRFALPVPIEIDPTIEARQVRTERPIEWNEPLSGAEEVVTYARQAMTGPGMLAFFLDSQNRVNGVQALQGGGYEAIKRQLVTGALYHNAASVVLAETKAQAALDEGSTRLAKKLKDALKVDAEVQLHDYIVMDTASEKYISLAVQGLMASFGARPVALLVKGEQTVTVRTYAKPTEGIYVQGYQQKRHAAEPTYDAGVDVETIASGDTPHVLHHMFRSGLRELLAQKMPAKAHVDQVRKIASAAKADEVEWSGLDAFLTGKQAVSKPEMLAALEHTHPEIKEYVLSGVGDDDGDSFDEESERASLIESDEDGWRENAGAEDAKRNVQARVDGDLRDAKDALAGMLEWVFREEHDASIGQAMLPGTEGWIPKYSPQRDAETLVEALLQEGDEGPANTRYDAIRDGLPKDDADELDRLVQVMYDAQAGTDDPEPTDRDWPDYPGPDEDYIEERLGELRAEWESEHGDTLATRFAQYTEPGDKRDYTEILLTLPGIKGPDTHWTSDSYGTPAIENVVVHVRIDRRTDADGQPLAFIEEIQSDWHQKGREEGYIDSVKVAERREVLKRMNDAEHVVAAKREEWQGKLSAMNMVPQTTMGADRWWDGDSGLATITMTTSDGDKWELRRDPGLQYRRFSVFHNDAQVSLFFPSQWGRSLYEQSIGFLSAQMVEHRLIADPEYDEATSTVDRLRDEANALRGGDIERAPFDKTEAWMALGFKRALRWAADQGLTRVAWTTGAMQADRYNLAKQIHALGYEREGETFKLFGREEEDGSVRPLGDFETKELSGVVGKELAAKMTAGEGTPSSEIWARPPAGSPPAAKDKWFRVDLKVGGEGMKTFYDVMLPKYAERYTRKWGGTVGTAVLRQAVAVHVLDLTPELKKVIEEGQLLYSVQDDTVALLVKAGMPRHARCYSMSKSIALDLDNTLADYDGDLSKIGDPRPGARLLVVALRRRGADVVIFSARAATDDGRRMIGEWLEHHDFPSVQNVTAVKPADAQVFLDDRAVQFKVRMLFDPEGLADRLMNFHPVTKARVDVRPYVRAGRNVEGYDQEREDGAPDEPASPRPSAAPSGESPRQPGSAPQPRGAAPPAQAGQLPYKPMVAVRPHARASIPARDSSAGAPPAQGAPPAPPVVRTTHQEGAPRAPEKPPTPFPFQKEGIAWLQKPEHDDAILADEPGLGKTLQAIEWSWGKGPAMVVVPATIKTNWEREITRMHPDAKVAIVTGSKTFAPAGADYVIVNYDVLKRHVDSIKKYGFTSWIADEAHLFKNPETDRTKAMMAVNDVFKRRLAVTGTPVMQRPQELKTLALLTKRMSPAQDYWFSSKFSGGHLNAAGTWVESDKGVTNEAELRSFIDPFFLRRRKEDVLTQLPPKLHTQFEAPLSNNGEYQRAAADFTGYIRETGGDVAATRSGRAAAFSKINTLRQLSAMGKIPALKERLDQQIAAGQKSVVFAPFVKPLQEAHKFYPDNSVMLTGQETLKERQAAVDRFQKDPSVSTLFLSPAGGVGITLTAADTIFKLGRAWTPAANEQIDDRLHRIGQTRPVHVVDMVSPGSIDEAIDELNAMKASTVERTTEGSEGELDTESLLRMVRWAQRGSKVTGTIAKGGEYDHLDRKIRQRLTFAGLPVAIEHMGGQVRAWHDPHTDESGATRFRVRYGYFEDTLGSDGDEIDVFLGPWEDAGQVYVITQMKAPDFDRVDEEKVMVGFASEEEARAMYLLHYNNERFLGKITPMSLDEFKARLARGGRIVKAEPALVVYA